MPRLVMSCAVVPLIAAIAASASAFGICPECNPIGQTLTEEIAAMDAAVIGRLVKLTPPAGADEIPAATFEVVQILKGNGLVRVGDRMETVFFGDEAAGKAVLIMGISPPKLTWSTPLSISDRVRGYLARVLTLPEEGVERLAFFQEYLEDADELLARDAYNEFARAAYAPMKDLGPQMPHGQLVAWIKNERVSTTHRRLYFFMLGICGGEKDVPMLEGFLQSTKPADKRGLDALIGCYLSLTGEAGLTRIKELYLANAKSDYAETYSAITAIRFHIREGGVIEKKALVAALHPMLKRPELADLVIPDLARAEDWGPIDELMDLFRKADERSSWVRVPVVNYLRVCPLPRAKELLQECEKIDPAAYKRAHIFTLSAPAVPAKS